MASTTPLRPLRGRHAAAPSHALPPSPFTPRLTRARTAAAAAGAGGGAFGGATGGDGGGTGGGRGWGAGAGAGAGAAAGAFPTGAGALPAVTPQATARRMFDFPSTPASADGGGGGGGGGGGDGAEDAIPTRVSLGAGGAALLLPVPGDAADFLAGGGEEALRVAARDILAAATASVGGGGGGGGEEGGGGGQGGEGDGQLNTDDGVLAAVGFGREMAVAVEASAGVAVAFAHDQQLHPFVRSRVAAVADRLHLEHSLWHLLTHTFLPPRSAPSPGDTASERYAPSNGGGSPAISSPSVDARTPTLLTARRTLSAVEAAAATRLAAAPPALAALAPLDDPAYPAADTAAATGTAPTLDAARTGEESAATGRLALAALQAVRAGNVAAAASAARSVGGAAGMAAALLLGGVGGGAVATNGTPGGARASWLRVARKVAVAEGGSGGGGGVGPLERALLGVLAGSAAPAVAVLSDFEDLVWARLSAAVVTTLPRESDLSGRVLRGALRAAALGAVDGAVPLTGDGLRGVPGRGGGVGGLGRHPASRGASGRGGGGGNVAARTGGAAAAALRRIWCVAALGGDPTVLRPSDVVDLYAATADLAATASAEGGEWAARTAAAVAVFGRLAGLVSAVDVATEYDNALEGYVRLLTAAVVRGLVGSAGGVPAVSSTALVTAGGGGGGGVAGRQPTPAAARPPWDVIVRWATQLLSPPRVVAALSAALLAATAADVSVVVPPGAAASTAARRAVLTKAGACLASRSGAGQLLHAATSGAVSSVLPAAAGGTGGSSGSGVAGGADPVAALTLLTLPGYEQPAAAVTSAAALARAAFLSPGGREAARAAVAAIEPPMLAAVAADAFADGTTASATAAAAAAAAAELTDWRAYYAAMAATDVYTSRYHTRRPPPPDAATRAAAAGSSGSSAPGWAAGGDGGSGGAAAAAASAVVDAYVGALRAYDNAVSAARADAVAAITAVLCPPDGRWMRHAVVGNGDAEDGTGTGNSNGAGTSDGDAATRRSTQLAAVRAAVVPALASRLAALHADATDSAGALGVAAIVADGRWRLWEDFPRGGVAAFVRGLAGVAVERLGGVPAAAAAGVRYEGTVFEERD